MPGRPTVCALLLAAGRAERFGGDKLGQRLPGGHSVLARTVRGLFDRRSGVDGGVWLVARRAQALPWLGDLADTPSLHWVEMAWGLGQGDSIAAGASALPTGAATVIVLADQPFAAPEAVAAVVGALADGPDERVATARAGGVRTPPVAFGPAWRGRLTTLRGEAGARSLVAAAADVVDVDLPDGPWRLDLDTLDDLQRLVTAGASDTLAPPARREHPL